MRTAYLSIIASLLFCLLLTLQYHLWFVSGGIIDMLRLKKEVALQMDVNNQLKKRNDKLLRQLQYVQGNTDAMESRARGELGMIKKGETFYQVVK